MDSWNEVLRIPSESTSLTFDTTQNLLWTGDSHGYVQSYSSAPEGALAPYTKYRSSNDAIKQFLNHQDGILSLSSSNINFNTRKGIAKFSIPAPSDFTCLTTNCNSINSVIVGGNGLYKFDINRPLLSTLNYDRNVHLLHNSPKFLTVGLDKGVLELYDPVANAPIKQFQGHGMLEDIDVRGSYIATCGSSARRYQNEMMADPLVNIYDIRMMKPLAPYPFPVGASRVRFHPKLPNILVVASRQGQIQFVDIYDQTNVYFYQADIEGISSFEMSANGEFLAFAGADVHLWSMGTADGFVSFPAVTERADVERFPSKIDVDQNVPLNIIGMPYYKDPLLSNWPSSMIFTKETARVPEKERTPYIPPYRAVATKSKRPGVPRFLSEKRDKPQHIDIFSSRHNRHQIHYSKFGVKDFDFASYNHTAYAGLENHVDNSYGNALLQVWRFVAPVYNLVVGSIARESLTNTSSLTHDLGYLFDMMHKAKETNVTTTNLSQTINELAPELNNSDDGLTLDSQGVRGLCIALNRFLFAQVHRELAQHANHLTDMMGFTADSHLLSLDLVTPPSNVLNKMSILLSSNRAPTPATARKSTTLVTYLEYTVQRAQIKAFMPVVSLNVNLNNEELALIGSFKRWLVPEFFVSGNVVRASVPPHKYRKLPEGVVRYELAGYVCEMSSSPPHVKGAHHLVSYVRVDGSWVLFNDFLVTKVDEEEVFDLSWKRPVVVVYSSVGGKFKHYESGDFNVDTGALYTEQLIEKEKVMVNGQKDTETTEIQMDNTQGTDSQSADISESTQQISSSTKQSPLLDYFSEGTREAYRTEFELLTREEAPRPGMLVAIDAEFVTMKPEAVEMHYDGTRRVVRPKQISLARLSVLRGEGPKCGVAFIDDFIVHTGDIYDYTTSFSGIEPGDLDVKRSNKRLVTRQTAYRRLWLLLNMGVVFVGHGLYNDFRCINIHVPREQIRDTAELYYKSDFKRQLSLKFLVYVVLGKKVQTGNHDSLEDAHGALSLYKRWVELNKSGEFEGVLDMVYLEGQSMRFRVPQDIEPR